MYLLVSEAMSITLQHEMLKVQEGLGRPGPVGARGSAERADTWRSWWPWEPATVTHTRRTMYEEEI